MPSRNIREILGDKADFLLNHTSTTVPKNDLHLPSPNHIDEVWAMSNRSNQVLQSLQSLFDHSRFGGTGYCSIFPVDQGIEQSAGLALAPYPVYFNPENIIRWPSSEAVMGWLPPLASWASCAASRHTGYLLSSRSITMNYQAFPTATTKLFLER